MKIFWWNEVRRGLKLLCRLCPKGRGWGCIINILHLFLSQLALTLHSDIYNPLHKSDKFCKVFTFHLAFVKVSSCWTKYFTIPLSFEGWNYLAISIAAWNYVRKICVSGLHFGFHFGLRKFFLPIIVVPTFYHSQFVHPHFMFSLS